MKFSRRNLFFSGGTPYVPPPTPSFSDVYSVNFDGTNDFGSVAGSTVNAYFAHNAAFSFSIWVKPDVVAAERTFFSTRDAGSSFKGFLVEQVGATLLVQLNTAAAARTLTKASALSAGAWQHIVVTYSGNQDLSGFKVYINATSQTMSGSGTITASTVTTVNAQFGNDPQGSFFDGKIDDSAVFNVELTPTQVTEIYNSGNGYDLSESTVTANVMAWWLMGDDPTDDNTTIHDQIGSAHITLNGATITADAP
jgi:hypothetical protein